MKQKTNGDARRLPTATLKGYAADAARRVESVRKIVSSDREGWADLCAIPGVNKRWLRAFISSQIKQPPATKFMAIEWCLIGREGRDK